MSLLTEKTLQAITDRRVRPVPVWQVCVRDALHWASILFLVLLSALLTALSFHSISEIDWDAYAKADFSWFQVVLSGVPLLSFLLLALFIWVSTVLIRQTRRGYRYPAGSLLSFFLVANVAFGFLIEESPLDEPSERFLLALIPRHQVIEDTLVLSAERQWSQPERGLLSGEILSSDATNLQLIDVEEKQWTIDYSGAAVQSDVSLRAETEIKVIGKQQGKDTFRATEVRAWESSPKAPPAASKKERTAPSADTKDDEKESEQKKEDKDTGEEADEKEKPEDEDEEDQDDEGEDEDEDNHEDDEDEDGEDD